jgi:hypothetical protein
MYGRGKIDLLEARLIGAGWKLRQIGVRAMLRCKSTLEHRRARRRVWNREIPLAMASLASRANRAQCTAFSATVEVYVDGTWSRFIVVARVLSLFCRFSEYCRASPRKLLPLLLAAGMLASCVQHRSLARRTQLFEPRGTRTSWPLVHPVSRLLSELWRKLGDGVRKAA